jgi:hypothetical protein
MKRTKMEREDRGREDRGSMQICAEVTREHITKLKTALVNITSAPTAAPQTSKKLILHSQVAV